MAKTAFPQIVQVDADTPRDVTASNPLVIDDANASYGYVRIIDGDVICRVTTSVVVDKLERVPPTSSAPERRS
jgi:hypothetical protein